jgi:hypothetical protein
VVENGERGDRGDRGVAGERGPKGDHGQAGEPGRRGRRGAANPLAVVGYLILAAAVVLAFYAVWRNDHKIEEARQERIATINKVILDNCMEIEQLKKLQREEAWESYREAQDNARVLGIAFTAELRERLAEERDEDLRAYHAESCPRQPIPN